MDASNGYAEPVWTNTHAHQVNDVNSPVSMTSSAEHLTFASGAYAWSVDIDSGELIESFACYMVDNGEPVPLDNMFGGCAIAVSTEDAIYLANAFDELIRYRTFDESPGVLTQEDLAGEGPDGPHPLADRAMKPEAVKQTLVNGGPADRDSNIAPLFEPGQAVRTARPAGNRLVDGGHTRLPAYAAGATGRILRLHGSHVLPDSSAHRLGEAPEPLYAVAFPAAELWTDPEHPGDEVVLDLWQSYLHPA